MKYNKYFNICKQALLSFIGIVFPFFAHAQGGIPNPPAPGGGTAIQSPIGSTTIEELLSSVINYILGLVALIALLAIIVGGFKIILGFTNEDQVKQGKSVIKWAVIGLVVVLGAYAILSVVTGLLG